MNAPPNMPAPKGHLLIAIISHSRELDWEVPLSIYQCIYPLQAMGWHVNFATHIGDADLAGGRNMIFANAYLGPFTHLLCVDNDVSWKEGTIERMIQHPVDLVGGAYPKRSDNEGYPVRTNPKHRQFIDPVTREPRDDGLLLVDGVPTGFLMMSRNCLNRMVEAHKDQWYVDQRLPGGKAWNVFEFAVRNNQRVTEDFYFCEKWQAIGGDVWCDPHLTLHHHGGKTYSGGFAPYFRQAVANEAKREAETVGIMDLAKA